MRPGSKGVIGVKGKDAAWGRWGFSTGLFESLMEPGFQDTSFSPVVLILATYVEPTGRP